MQILQLPLTQTGQMHPLTQDYLLGKDKIKPLYQWPLSLEGMQQAIDARKQYPVNRAVLAESLRKQYKAMDASFFENEENRKVAENIKWLEAENTFTITTGHQLNIFTGPLFFVYKLISAIKYAEQLKQRFTENHFVPVYWMASEDHDFEEISHIHLWGRTLKWETEAGGPVGRMDAGGLNDVLGQLKELLGDKAADLVQLFEEAYRQGSSLAQATRFIVHRLLGRYGIVVLDADSPELKKQFASVLQQDIIRQIFEKKIKYTLEGLKEYKLPVNPRAINVFYLADNGRYRIVDEEGYFQVKEAGKRWTVDELLAELEANPERFSPNVVLRPMYQEVILPNLAYIGGNNEIAYWLELKAAFETAHVFFPQLVVRDSALWLGKRAMKDMENLGLKPEDLFISLKGLKDRFYELQSLTHPAEQRLEEMLSQYESLRADLQSLSPQMVASLVKGINQHQKEVKKWQKEVHDTQLEQEEKNIQKLEKLHASIFPEGSFQERYENLLPYYIQYGPEFFDRLYEAFDPLQASLSVFKDA